MTFASAHEFEVLQQQMHKLQPYKAVLHHIPHSASHSRCPGSY